jgi:hypothetical protein
MSAPFDDRSDEKYAPAQTDTAVESTADTAADTADSQR